MKHFRLLVLFLSITGLFVISSCSDDKEKEKEKTAVTISGELSIDNPNVIGIPADANMVMLVDLGSVYNKAGLGNLDQYKMYTLLMTDLQQNEPETAKIIEKLLNNPGETGLDVGGGMSFFLTGDNIDKPEMTYLFMMEDEATFERFLKTMSEMTGNPMPDIEEANGTKQISRGDMAAIWDDKMLGISVRGDFKGRLDQSLKCDKSASIVSNENFVEFFNNLKDLNFWLDLGIAGQEVDNMEEMKEMGIELKGSYVHATLEFGKDELALVSKVYPNKSLSEYYDYDSYFNDGMSEGLLNYFPKKNLAMLSFDINFEELYLTMLKNEEISAQMGDAGMMAQAIVGELDGEILVCVSNYGGGALPEMTVAVKVNSDALYKMLAQNVPIAAVDKNGMKYVEEYNAYYGYKDGVILITNSDETAANFTNGGYGNESLAQSTDAADLKSSPMMLRLNIDQSIIGQEQYQALIDDLEFEYNTGLPPEMFVNIVNSMEELLESFTIKVEDGNTSKISLKMDHDQENIIQAILKLVDDNAQKML